MTRPAASQLRRVELGRLLEVEEPEIRWPSLFIPALTAELRSWPAPSTPSPPPELLCGLDAPSVTVRPESGAASGGVAPQRHLGQLATAHRCARAEPPFDFFRDVVARAGVPRLADLSVIGAGLRSPGHFTR